MNLATINGSIATTLVFLIGLGFFVAPRKTNEIFGTWTTENSRPWELRVMGAVFMLGAAFFELMFLVKFPG